MARQFISRAAVWITAALLAAASVSASIGAITKHRRPDVALAAWPVNGFAYAELADDTLKQQARAARGLFPSELGPEMPRWAHEALLREPTSVVGMRTLALHAASQGEHDKARNLMRLAADLNKRDMIVNVWLIEEYSRTGDLQRTLQMYDQTLRSLSFESRGFLLTTMARALEDPVLITPYYHLLRSSPPWAEAFWQQAAQTPAAIGNAATLRGRLASSGTGLSSENDARLLNGLVGLHMFEEAANLYGKIAGASRGSGNLLRNGDFSHEPGLPPFDWKTVSKGEFGAGINTNSGALEISAVPGARGTVAEQLVQLRPGHYNLRVGVTGDMGGAETLSFEVSCAEDASPQEPVVRTPVVVGRNGLRFDLPATKCRFYWARINLAVEETDDGVDLSLDRLLLTRA